MSKRFALAAALVFAAGSSSVGAVTPIVTLSNVTVANQFLDLDLGIDFNVTSAVVVDSLGAFTNGSSPITVTLYKLTSSSTGSVVTSAIVGGTPVAGSNYAFTSIAPITLTAGSYQIAARYTDPGNGNYNPNNGNTATVLFDTLGGRLGFTGDYYNYPGSATIASTLDGVSQLSYGAGTFTATAVPEPATWGLLIAGFAMVGAASRRRRVGLAA